MKKQSSFPRRMARWLAGLAALILMIAWSGGCFDRKLPAGQSAPGARELALPDGAELATARVDSVSPLIDLVGTVESREQIHLSSRVSAYINDVFASAGDAVTNGQLLVDLDDREMNMQLAIAQAELTQAEIEFRRTQELIRANAATDQQLTSARAAFDRALEFGHLLVYAR